MEQAIIPRGLRPTPEDPRDFALGALYSLPKLETLPKIFTVQSLGIKDQGDSDYCTAYATSVISEVQEGKRLLPEYSFALSKELSGDVDEWGQDIRTACKAHTIGALPRSLVPTHLFEGMTDHKKRRMSEWEKINPLIRQIAKSYRKKSYFKVVGPYDHYDNLRAAMYKFNGGAVSGVNWSWPLSQVFIKTIGAGTGHAIAYVGWTPEGLQLQNSYGKLNDNAGVHAVSREVVNHFVEMYGAYMFIDIDPEEAKGHLASGTSPEDGWFKNLITNIRNFIWR
jgi:hypothetical protein